MITCPICQKPFDAKEERTAKPFCSNRCRNVDLSRWFNEDYGVPWDGDPDDLEQESEVEGSSGKHSASGN